MRSPRAWLRHAAGLAAVLALALALALAVPAGEVAAQPPLWVVHGPHATLVLFGSVHLLPPGLDWEPADLKQALSQAQDIWFEIPMDDATALSAAQVAIARGVQPPGVKLDTQLSAAGRARLARVAQANGTPLEGLQRLRPWLAEVTLALANYRKSGASQDEGVEHQLAAGLAPGVPRMAFETAREQIEALSSASLADQVASLEEALVELEHDDDGYKRLVKAWMAGDVAGLQHEALDPLKSAAPGEYRALVVARNQHWLDRIHARLQGSGEAVMVVGVGHLVGPDGLPALLRAQGFRVDGP